MPESRLEAFLDMLAQGYPATIECYEAALLPRDQRERAGCPAVDAVVTWALRDDETLNRARYEMRDAGLPTKEGIRATHVTDDPDVVTRELKAGTDLAQTRQAGDLGPGLYFSGAPELWKGRSRRRWDWARSLAREKRQSVVDAALAQLDARGPGYITADERKILERDLADFVETGSVWLLQSAAAQPFNIRFDKEILEPLGIRAPEPPADVEGTMRGRFVDWPALVKNKGLLRAYDRWAVKNGYKDEAGNILPKAHKHMRAFGDERALLVQFLRDAGYNGAYAPMAPFQFQFPQLNVWDNAAIRRFGAWQNPRPAPAAHTIVDELLKEAERTVGMSAA